MPKLVKVARAEDLGPGEKVTVEVDGELIVVVNLDGEYFALADVCTHDGGPLGHGKLEGAQLICPRHGARFDVRSGAALSLPAFEAAPVYDVRVENGEVFVEF